MRGLIVNADDLGAYAERSNAILRAFSDGVVSSATLICNGDDAADAARKAREIGLPLGMHFTITDGRPLAPATCVPTLVNDAGMLLDRDALRSALQAGRVRSEDIARECEAQLDWFMRHCGMPTHIDGHQHMHVHPCVLPVCCAVIQAHGIQRMRIPDEALPSQAPMHLRAAVADATRARSNVSARSIRAPRFCGMLFAARACLSTFAQLVAALPEGVTELMVHPGYAVEERGWFDMHPARQAELDTLLDPAAADALQRERVQLLSFADL